MIGCKRFVYYLLLKLITKSLHHDRMVGTYVSTHEVTDSTSPTGNLRDFLEGVSGASWPLIVQPIW